jgi:SAM-dependent methyltransferase
MQLSDLNLSAMEERSAPGRWGAGNVHQDRRLYYKDDLWFKVWAPEYIQSQAYRSGVTYIELGPKNNELVGFRVGYFDKSNSSALVDFIYDETGVLRGYICRAGKILPALPREFLRAAARKATETGWVMADLVAENVIEVAGQLSFIDYDARFCELRELDIEYERANGCFAGFRDPYYAGLLEGFVEANWRPSTAAETPDTGAIQFGDLRRLSPISSIWGVDRGRPIDRFYIDRFIRAHGNDIKGRVLEVGDSGYVQAFGKGGITAIDFLHRHEGAGASIVGDLTDLPGVEDDFFDCIVLTQALQFVFDVRAAIATCYRILRPGGVLLATVPGISHISHHPTDTWKEHELWCWSFSIGSIEKLFEPTFGKDRYEVVGHGNVLSAISFLEGLAVSELQPFELEHRDPDYDLVITVRAVKPL